MSIVECVPNVSEGRRPSIIDACARAIEGAGLPVLDIHSDAAHNRTVFTFAGPPAAVEAAALALASVAVASIDLGHHDGVHPRVGAIDVVPFVPIADTTLDDCVAMARAFGAEFARRHHVPVFLYEAAATSPARRRLETIRRGGLASLAERMAGADWPPDFGPAQAHPSAGVTVVGARIPLIAYNITLVSDRVELATAIARTVRESSGGLPCVKALGLPLADQHLIQVSMNLTDFRVTSMRTVFDAVTREAEARGVSVAGSELVGLVPAAALSDEDAAHLRIAGYDGSQILERRIAALG
jgi:glutamate formiminotransferase/formiminotetrahydrofolate cyclodeaminase